MASSHTLLVYSPQLPLCTPKPCLLLPGSVQQREGSLDAQPQGTEAAGTAAASPLSSGLPQGLALEDSLPHKPTGHMCVLLLRCLGVLYSWLPAMPRAGPRGPVVHAVESLFSQLAQLQPDSLELDSEWRCLGMSCRRAKPKAYSQGRGTPVQLLEA